MPWSLERYQDSGELHFITFSCYRRKPFLGAPQSRTFFEETLERTRQWYGFLVAGYVVMPEHVHLLITEPEEKPLAIAMQMLKQLTSRKLGNGSTFWLKRYYDFNVWTHTKYHEKLSYIHLNPVARGLVNHSADWQWSSFRHWATGADGIVQIESTWTARRRARAGVVPVIGCAQG